MKNFYPFPNVSRYAVLALFLAYGILLPNFAHAESCQAKAASLAAAKGGNVLSVSSQGNRCKIKLLIPSAKGPPKSKVFVVRK